MDKQNQPEIFNRANVAMMRKSGQAATISLYPARRRIRFNQAAVELMELKVGQYIHFLLYNKKEWCVVANDDDTGFLLSSDSKKKEYESMVINCSHYIAHMLSVLKRKPINTNFYLNNEAKHKHKGKEVILIMTDKTVEEMMKQMQS